MKDKSSFITEAVNEASSVLTEAFEELKGMNKVPFGVEYPSNKKRLEAERWLKEIGG